SLDTIAKRARLQLGHQAGFSVTIQGCQLVINQEISKVVDSRETDCEFWALASEIFFIWAYAWPKALSGSDSPRSLSELFDGAGLTASETQRYSRHLVLPKVGPEGQKMLKRSSVLVVGLGGLGIPAAVYLASAGVGRVGIADADRVEMSNLQRQFIFSKADLGQRKVDAAVEKLGLINPEIRVIPHPVKLDSSNAMDVIREYYVVIDATDNLPSTYLIKDACVL